MADTVKKNMTANTGKYTYQYVDIAQIHAYLESIGASYYQYVDRIGDDDYIMTVKIIDGKESQPLRGARIVDAKLVGVSNPAQEQGSAITYARRYSLLMAFGLATEDDDAQSLSRKPKSAESDNLTLLRAKLKGMMTTEQWSTMLSKYGSSMSWTEEQMNKWISQIEERNNA